VRSFIRICPLLLVWHKKITLGPQRETDPKVFFISLPSPSPPPHPRLYLDFSYSPFSHSLSLSIFHYISVFLSLYIDFCHCFSCFLSPYSILHVLFRLPFFFLYFFLSSKLFLYLTNIPHFLNNFYVFHNFAWFPCCSLRILFLVQLYFLLNVPRLLVCLSVCLFDCLSKNLMTLHLFCLLSLYVFFKLTLYCKPHWVYSKRNCSTCKNLLKAAPFIPHQFLFIVICCTLLYWFQMNVECSLVILLCGIKKQQRFFGCTVW
jgi:hypothetical protein